MTEIGWKDQHGDRGHVLLGWGRVALYSPPEDVNELVGEDVVGMISVQNGEITHAVYLTRPIAEILLNGLRKTLAEERPKRTDICDAGPGR